MTLLDAPKYDAARERRHKHIVIAVFVLAVLSAFGTWWFWNWPEEHHVSGFLKTVESGDLTKAYALWNEDPECSNTRNATRPMAFTASSRTGGAAAHTGKFAVISRPFQILGQRRDYGCEHQTAAKHRFSCGWIARPRRSTSLLWSCIGPYGIPDGIQGHRERSGWPGLDVRSWHLLEQVKPVSALRIGPKSHLCCDADLF